MLISILATIFLVLAMTGIVKDASRFQFLICHLAPSAISFTICYLVSKRDLRFTELYGTVILVPFIIVSQTFYQFDAFDEIE